jgi:Fur family ferric uptake transcriptional regulator
MEPNNTMQTWETTYNALLARLHDHGERLTLQRKIVLQAVCQAEGHRTVAEIAQTLNAMGYALDESTIYRILQRFNQLGIVSQTDLGKQGVVYELIAAHSHHHLVCLSCHHVYHVDDQFVDEMRDRVRATYKFEPRIDHLAIFGWCEACQKKLTESRKSR